MKGSYTPFRLLDQEQSKNERVFREANTHSLYEQYGTYPQMLPLGRNSHSDFVIELILNSYIERIQ